MILVDTSVWIGYLRGDGTPGDLRLRRVIDAESHLIAITEPVAMELTAGATNDVAMTRITRLVRGLPLLGVEPALDFDAAASLFRSTRLAGLEVRSMIDCLIAAVALRRDATVLHADRDYAVIGRVTALRQELVR